MRLFVSFFLSPSVSLISFALGLFFHPFHSECVLVWMCMTICVLYIKNMLHMPSSHKICHTLTTGFIYSDKNNYTQREHFNKCFYQFFFLINHILRYRYHGIFRQILSFIKNVIGKCECFYHYVYHCMPRTFPSPANISISIEIPQWPAFFSCVGILFFFCFNIMQCK